MEKIKRIILHIICRTKVAILPIGAKRRSRFVGTAYRSPDCVGTKIHSSTRGIYLLLAAYCLLPTANCLWSKATSRFICINCFLFVIILSGLPTFSKAQSVSVIRGPYLQVGTPNSMVVRWRTDSLTPVNSRVYYCIQPDSVVIVDDTSLTTEHEIKITGLSPNTRYYYAIATSDSILMGPDSMQYFQTSPLPGTEQLVRVWAIGDFGEGNNGQRGVRDAYKNFLGNKHTDVWVWLGDNAYDDGTDLQYQTNVFDMYPEIFANTVLWPSPGNHDYLSVDTTTTPHTGVYYDIFTMPVNGEAGGSPSGLEEYYSFDYGNVHFVSLNSESPEWNGLFWPANIDFFARADMISWLKNDLANTNQPWIIAYWHQTPYSKGTHDSDEVYPNTPFGFEFFMKAMRDSILPVLEDHGVDLVLCGHSHNYERSYLIHGHYGFSDTFDTTTMLLDSSSGRLLDGTPYIKNTTGPNANYGTVYTVVGCSSKKGNFGSDGQLDHPVMYTGDYVLGSMMLEIHGNQLDAYFIDTNGAVLDSFTIFKDSIINDVGIISPALSCLPSLPLGINKSSISDHQSLIVYPNPFSDKLQIEYTLNSSGFVLLEIYNIFGQKVYTVVEEKQKRGKYSCIVDVSATVLSKGVYVLRFKSGEILNVKKIIIF